MNPPVNEKLYRVRVLLKAPGHLYWTLRIFFFFFNGKVSGVYIAGRKPSRPQIILLPFLGLFIISALLHTIPLLLDILPTVISVLACTLFSCFLLHSSLRSMLLPISCQASPWRITKGIGNNQTTLPYSQKQTWVVFLFCFFIIDHLVSSLSQLRSNTWKLFLDMALVSYFAFHSSRLFI